VCIETSCSIRGKGECLESSCGIRGGMKIESLTIPEFMLRRDHFDGGGGWDARRVTEAHIRSEPLSILSGAGVDT